MLTDFIVFSCRNDDDFNVPPGPSLQGRTRFLNRDPGLRQSVQKSQPINLDQDPDQEVVTTTKTEVDAPQYTN